MASIPDKLVSPNGFDGRGPVPEKVTAAAKRIGKLRVAFITGERLTPDEIRELFDASAVQAEWMRALYEAVHDLIPQKGSENEL